MCGIAGIRDEVLAATGGSFARALQALAWRGRDGQGQVSVGGWRLGVARLAITDPGAGQPLAGPQGIAIAFNGAVTSARAEWQQFGSGRRTRNDAELPLLRLHHAGPAHLAPRCGHHAFAVVAPDGRAWLARDPFGEKPLYVVYEGGRALAFASTVPALRALGFEIELDEREVAAFFKRGWHGTPRVAGPGRTLDDARTGVWSADDGSDVPQAAAAWPARPLHARLAAAVERCAAAEVPVGLALSGGIDSACIAACLPAPARAQVHAFQFRARGAPGGERAVAAAVAGALGMRLVEVDGGPELLDDLMLLTRAHGLPLGDPSVLAAHAVAKAAANEGVRVLLSGEGGDELFFG
ncbi:MAG TPA: asparagine synthase-related protein, partial [Planctomycetota bacterium]|nr:asparagine synthase-related protein [Planctomycetota bacterium]